MKASCLFILIFAGIALADQMPPTQVIYRIPACLIHKVEANSERVFVRFEGDWEKAPPNQAGGMNRLEGSTFLVRRGKGMAEADWKAVCDQARNFEGKKASVWLSGLSFVAFTKSDGVRPVFTMPPATLKISVPK